MEPFDDPESVFASVLDILSSWRRAITRAGRIGVRVFGSALFANAHNTPLRSPLFTDPTSNSFAVVDGRRDSTNVLFTYFAVMYACRASYDDCAVGLG